MIGFETLLGLLLAPWFGFPTAVTGDFYGAIFAWAKFLAPLLAYILMRRWAAMDIVRGQAA